LAQFQTTFFPVTQYALAETLASGQAFRWREWEGAWEGVVGRRWARLREKPGGIEATSAAPAESWAWLAEYLQINVDIERVIETFPKDEQMQSAVQCMPGLRLLKQDPWECLASFILSSTKQIVQIQQIVSLVCERFGEPLPAPPGSLPSWSFPSPETIAGLTENDLRCCKMGFRAPYLHKTARMAASGELDLESLRSLPVEQAREHLMKAPGVGKKIADCALLFAYGFQEAFPVDVWVLKAIKQLYFPRKRPSRKRIERFTETHFGPNAGYAQQYLFHYMRTRIGRGARKTVR
jgi:N-glycosylase/DNA lyase